MAKIGVTEQGDGGLDQSWRVKLAVVERSEPRVIRVNTSTFWTKCTNPVSISWLVPGDFRGPRIEDIYHAAECLIPPSWLVRAAKGTKAKGDSPEILPITWQEYVRQYAHNFWTLAHEYNIVQGHQSVTPILQYILEQVAYRLNATELTLCCWEGIKNEECHRKIVYDKLPPYMKGLRA